MDFVWVFLRMYIDLKITDKRLNVNLGAVGQHVTNGVTGNGLAIVTGQQIPQIPS